MLLEHGAKPWTCTSADRRGTASYGRYLKLVADRTGGGPGQLAVAGYRCTSLSNGVLPDGVFGPLAQRHAAVAAEVPLQVDQGDHVWSFVDPGVIEVRGLAVRPPVFPVAALAFVG